MNFKNTKLKIFFISIIFFGFFGIAQSSQAADHYVSPAGSDTWVNSTNINTPTSPAIAFVNAQAGDTVYFREGTYNVPVCPNRANDYFCGYYMPTNSGTSDNPIVFQAYLNENPVMNGIEPDTVGCSGGCHSQVLIAIESKSHIVLDGFTFQESGGVDMPTINIVKTNTNYPEYNTIRNCIFNGGSTNYATGGSSNRQGVFLQDT
jgi:hypothetical protein